MVGVTGQMESKTAEKMMMVATECKGFGHLERLKAREREEKMKMRNGLCLYVRERERK